MKGALVELKAKGSEDINLIGNPSISFFKSVHKKHTNFCRFEKKNIFYGQPNFGSKYTCKVERYGDLLTKMWLQIILPPTGDNFISWIKCVGNYMIKEVILKFGGEEICKMSGEYIDIFHKYYLNTGHYNTYSSGVRNLQGHNNTTLTEEQILLIPLPFWFSKHISQALPLITLNYTNIEVDVVFRPINDLLYTNKNKTVLPTLINLNNLKIQECFLFCEYIYLDSQERLMFLHKKEINYLIEQIQETTYKVFDNEKQNQLPIKFNLPTKELIWIYRSDNNININKWNLFNYTGNNNKVIEPFKYISLTFNGNERIEKTIAQYFRINIPISSHNSSNADLIYSYNFALNCDNIQPSGSVNFSKINDTKLHIEYSNNINNGISSGEVILFGVNYNFLKIKKGMAGIVYN